MKRDTKAALRAVAFDLQTLISALAAEPNLRIDYADNSLRDSLKKLEHELSMELCNEGDD